MMVTTRKALTEWLEGLMDHYSVIAPTDSEGFYPSEQELRYERVASSAAIAFDFQRTLLSAKTFFLPETEVLLEIDRSSREVVLSEPTMDQEQVLFGLRPCDAAGLLALDALLLDRAPADACYAERREKSTLIVLACSQLWEGCFCTSLGSAPDDPSGADIMLYESGDGYDVEAITNKGAELLKGLHTTDAEANDGRDPRENRHQAAPALAESGHVPVLPPEAWQTLHDHPYWQRLADRCLSCRACTYVCPTCRCFDVRDETILADAGHVQIQRLRAWDSCMAPAYRRMAGGHNHRPSKAQRLRNRYYCKFCYSPQDFGAVACVGCGRCIEVCPVGIDIAEMLADVAALEKGA